MTRLLDFWFSGAPWGWLGLGLILLVLELATGTTYLLWFAVAAGATGLVMVAVDVAWQVQLAMFAIFTLIFAGGGRRFLRPGWMKTDRPGLNEGEARVVGRTAFAVADFTSGMGRARLDDSVWGARAVSDDPILGGEPLEIVGLDGATLQVRKVVGG